MNLRNHLLADDHNNSEVTKKKYLFSFFGYNFKNWAKIVIFKISNVHIWMFVNSTNDNITFFKVNYFNKCRF